MKFWGDIMENKHYNYFYTKIGGLIFNGIVLIQSIIVYFSFGYDSSKLGLYYALSTFCSFLFLFNLVRLLIIRFTHQKELICGVVEGFETDYILGHRVLITYMKGNEEIQISSQRGVMVPGTIFNRSLEEDFIGHKIYFYLSRGETIAFIKYV